MQRLDLLPDDERAEGGAVLDMTVAGHDQRYGMTVLTGTAGEIRVPLIDAAPGSAIRLRIRARDVMLATERPQGLSALNILAGKIGGLSSDRGPLVDVKIDCNGQSIVSRLTRQSTHALESPARTGRLCRRQDGQLRSGKHDARHTFRFVTATARVW